MDDFRRRSSRPQTAPGQLAVRARGRPQLRTPYGTSHDLELAENSLQMFGESQRSSSNGKVTSRIISSVKRSLSYGAAGKKQAEGMSAIGMYSTPEESLSPASSRDDFFSRPQTSPTVQQIAMGLHMSRTPHLGSSKACNPRTRLYDTPVATSSRPTHHRRDSAPPTIIQLPQPPQRSALKTSNAVPQSASHPSLIVPSTPSDSRTSLSTLTSTTGPSTPRSNRSNSLRPTTFASRLQSSMSRLLQPMRKNSASSIVTSNTAVSTLSSESNSGELTPRKMVRFSSSAGGGEDA
ncbi:hypothetical protein BDY19DRAFT_991190 [Irpex rosettiformis]|uniref:Uncharacterized protein n=1 Tax=Irpex rosettiformis TaxID=378272 RepID=A0ACB8UAX2_9APHY|nr:hypothetical protein BDY19DRAFT_991190 [Irpex rosettiformis]